MCPDRAWTQNQKDKVEPSPAPLLPAEEAWLVMFSAPPAAGGAIDGGRVYIPLRSNQVVALNRETGEAVWTRDIESRWPPVVSGGVLFIPASDAIHALDPTSGDEQWRVSFDGRMIAPLTWTCGYLVSVLEPGEAVAFRPADGHIAWRHPLGATSSHTPVCEGPRVFLTVDDGRVVALALADGTRLWEQRLPGTLSEPAVARDRVFVGSTDNFLYALDADSGKLEWRWRSGGDVIGAAIGDEDVVYFASLDNILRAVNRGNGNQRWKEEITKRPALPPRTFGGVVLLTGVGKELTTFSAKDGQPINSYTAPAELEGPPLIDPDLKPYRVAFVVVTRDGRAVGLRPTGMMFREPSLSPLERLPGRRLSREQLP